MQNNSTILSLASIRCVYYTQRIDMRDAAQKLVKARKAEKLSQAAMAAKLGVTANTVARWERREIPIPQWVSRLQKLEETHATKLAQFESQLARLQQANIDLLPDLRLKDMEIS